jgi:hypothetical protein
MTFLLCRNTVKDYDQWKAVFDSHQALHQEAGFRLIQIWRKIGEPNNIFFLFEVASREKAQAFIDDPVSARAGDEAGVVEGEYHCIKDAGGYSS